MLNTIVLGKYEINKQVRENDLFIQYWGRDTQTSRDVTVIAIHTRIASAADFLPRFEAAAIKFANLKSKHTAALIEFGAVSGQAVIVYEYTDGLSLSSALASSGNGLPMEIILDVAQQLGEYLETLHSLRLTQISFNFEDIFLSAENLVSVLNFGIAQGVDLGGLLSANKILAHSSYAPELLNNNKTDVHTDFYSLGALLFQALTGKELNPGFASADKTLIEDFFPSRLRMEISGEWDVLVAKCLHPNPAKRIQSAAEFLNQVNEIRHTTATLVSDNPLGMEDSLIGQTLGGYRLVSRLGQGGMATVYKAYEPALDRYVAIKVLPQFFAKDPVFVQRFRREAKAVAQLNHPNIVPIYSYGESGGITYIAMQFVVGDTLKHEGQKYNFDESLRLLAPIARALGYAHQRGIVHRDVKPSNILLADGNWPVLADFGLAQMAQVSGKLTESGVGMGTPMYMSPEQGQGDKVDHRTDIYSLGIVLYEMITGDVPFRADTPMAIVIKHISAPMPMPRQVNSNIPDYLEAIILKATAKNPDDRYQTAEELAAAMENALSRVSSSTPITLAAQTKIPLEVTQKSALPEPKPMGGAVAQPSAFKKMLRVVMFAIMGIIGTVFFGIVLMGILDVCPPSGPWQMPPWCEGSTYQLPTIDKVDEVTPAPVVTDVPTSAPVAFAGMVLDDFDSELPAGRSEWESYFDDNVDTQLDCYVEDSGVLRDSNYLNFEFEVVENSWATCGIYFDTIQNWAAAQGIEFYLRSAEANIPYEITLFSGTPDARSTYVYLTETPSESVDDWVRVEILWQEILGVSWEDHADMPIDPAKVIGFAIGFSAPEAESLSGVLWLDDLRLLGEQPPVSTEELDLFIDDFENLDRVDLESYFLEESDTRTTCMLDETTAHESASSLQFQFDAAPDAWASCNISFNEVADWSAGQGVAFYVHADQADIWYDINLFGGTPGVDETYLYELVTTSESVDGWQRVEVYWGDLLRADWEENSGTPVNPASIIGFSFDTSAPQQERLNGTLWFDDFQVIP